MMRDEKLEVGKNTAIEEDEVLEEVELKLTAFEVGILAGVISNAMREREDITTLEQIYQKLMTLAESFYE